MWTLPSWIRRSASGGCRSRIREIQSPGQPNFPFQQQFIENFKNFKNLGLPRREWMRRWAKRRLRPEFSVRKHKGKRFAFWKWAFWFPVDFRDRSIAANAIRVTLATRVPVATGRTKRFVQMVNDAMLMQNAWLGLESKDTSARYKIFSPTVSSPKNRR